MPARQPSSPATAPAGRIVQTVSAQLPGTLAKECTRHFALPWSHYVRLLAVRSIHAARFTKAKPCEVAGQSASSIARFAAIRAKNHPAHVRYLQGESVHPNPPLSNEIHTVGGPFALNRRRNFSSPILRGWDVAAPQKTSKPEHFAHDGAVLLFDSCSLNSHIVQVTVASTRIWSNIQDHCRSSRFCRKKVRHQRLVVSISYVDVSPIITAANGPTIY